MSDTKLSSDFTALMLAIDSVKNGTRPLELPDVEDSAIEFLLNHREELTNLIGVVAPAPEAVPAVSDFPSRMTDAHYAILEAKLDELGADVLRAMTNTYHRSNLSHKQFRWDMLYRTGLVPPSFATNEEWPVYEYLNDDHIDDALRQYCRSRDYAIDGWT